MREPRGRGDELPEQLRTGEGRRAWLREAKRQLEAQRAKEARPVPRGRGKRLKEAKRRLDEELWSETRANRAYERYRSGRMKDGRRCPDCAPTRWRACAVATSTSRTAAGAGGLRPLPGQDLQSGVIRLKDR